MRVNVFKVCAMNFGLLVRVIAPCEDVSKVLDGLPAGDYFTVEEAWPF